MFRLGLKLKNFPNISKSNQCLRYYSGNGEKSNSAKVGLIVGSSVVLVSGLSLGYAKYDSGFRKKMEKTIPYSDKLLDTLLGPIAANKDSVIPSITESKDKRMESSFMTKKKERTESLHQLNQNIKIDGNNNEPKKEDKTKDISLQTNEKINSKNNEKQNNDFDKSESFSSKEETEEEKSDKPTDKALLDIDVMIAREALKEQLMSVLPTDGQEFKELQKRFNDIELEYERKISKLEERFETELKTQLKRQLSAFNDHLSDQMSNLRQQLKRNYDNSLEEKLLEEKSRFQSDLSNSFYRLHLLEQLLKAREELDRDQYSFRKLWVLCQSLREALNDSPSLSDECSPVSLSQEMSAIESILSKDSLNEMPLIRLALETIPKEVTQNGVFTEKDLIKRFQKVDKYCKRVALIGDNGGNLYLYFLSYIQSLLVFRDRRISAEELEGKEVDPLKWDTFDLLTRVQYHLNNHNLEMALKYANQLRGEPRNVAKDWIKDTRLHLELKQAVDLLQTEADAINVQIVN